MLHLNKINGSAATSSLKNGHRMKKRQRRERKQNKILNRKMLAARLSAQPTFLTEEKTTVVTQSIVRPAFPNAAKAPIRHACSGRDTKRPAS